MQCGKQRQSNWAKRSHDHSKISLPLCLPSVQWFPNFLWPKLPRNLKLYSHPFKSGWITMKKSSGYVYDTMFYKDVISKDFECYLAPSENATSQPWSTANFTRKDNADSEKPPLQKWCVWTWKVFKKISYKLLFLSFACLHFCAFTLFVCPRLKVQFTRFSTQKCERRLQI